MLTKTYENKSLVKLNGLKPGEKVKVRVDAKGVPLEKKWRDRLRDAKIDGAFMPVNKGGKK